MALSADEIDDILYLVRVNEQDELTTYANELAQKHSITRSDILINSVDSESKNTAIHYCAANGFTGLLGVLFATIGTEQVSHIINKQNDSGNTPLHWAAFNGHMDTTKALIAAGVDMWIRNFAGNLAIFEAERAGKDDIVAYLLEVGGTEKEQEIDGGSAVSMTMSAGEPVSAGMNIDEAGDVDEDVDDAGVKLEGASLNG